MSFLVKYEVYGVKYELQRGIFDLCEHMDRGTCDVFYASIKRIQNPESWTNKESLFLSRPLKVMLLGGK